MDIEALIDFTQRIVRQHSLSGEEGAVAQIVGKAQQAAFSPARIGLMIAGFEVPHVHVHVVPVEGMRDLDFANADGRPSPAALDDAAARLRAALRALGAAAAVDA